MRIRIIRPEGHPMEAGEGATSAERGAAPGRERRAGNNGGADQPSPRLRLASGTRTPQRKKRCASSRFLRVVLGAFMPSPLRGSRLRHLLSRDQGHARARGFDFRRDSTLLP